VSHGTPGTGAPVAMVTGRTPLLGAVGGRATLAPDAPGRPGRAQEAAFGPSDHDQIGRSLLRQPEVPTSR
jgi:hypothetical protein